ncbi:MAG: PTS sugar transporter subunit IIA [Endomicrobium sp.]|jgi:PTS system mannose-specific IIA component|nr:PTS sugar transporter subunit IIA [Endomicrobium sp.]
MIKIIIVAHGELAQELVNSAEIIVGEQSNLFAVKKGTNDSLVQMQERIDDLLNNINDENGTLILTDMIGGTPFNASALMVKSFNIEVLSGVNLPMVLSAIVTSKNAVSVSYLADKILRDGKKSILNVRKILFKADK